MSKIITQWGSEATPFRAYKEDLIRNYVKLLQKFISEVAAFSGFDIFATYGTLLGGVREKKVIAHDFDFDLAVIVNNFNDKKELIEKFKHLIREIKNYPGVVKINPASATQYGISFKGENITFTIDLFLAWFDEDDYFIQSFSIDKRFLIKRSDIYPLSSIEVNGVELPSPINKELILRCIYGADWKIPNPSFNYQDYFNELGGQWPAEFTIFGKVKHNQEYWNNYYTKSSVNSSPSQFGVFANSYIKKNSRILEFGSGNGRDTFFLNDSGHYILGTDYSEASIDLIQNKIDGDNINNIDLLNLDYADYIKISSFYEENSNAFDVIYSRFLFHAVSEPVELNLLEIAANVLKVDGIFLTEFRVEGDGHYDKCNPWNESEITGDHYRRPINPEIFSESLRQYGFEIEYKVTGKGYAFHTLGDPTVCRIVAKKLPE